MVHTEDLEKIVALALCSAYVEGDKPLSLLLISDRPEAGKSEIVKRFSGTPNVEFASDVSGFGIRRDFVEKIKHGELKHIIIPEFLQPLMKGRVSAQSFTTTLQCLMEDGVMGLHSGFMKASFASDTKDARTVGFIGCLPRPLFTKQLRYEWLRTGFLSRWLVVTYRYDDDAINGIIQSIEDGDYLKQDKDLQVMDGITTAIEIPKEVAKACTNLALEIVKSAKESGLAYGFREIKHIRVLVMANVIHDRIVNGSQRVEAAMDDFSEVERLGYLFNEQFNCVRN